jgi:hypothetical protein
MTDDIEEVRKKIADKKQAFYNGLREMNGGEPVFGTIIPDFGLTPLEQAVERSDYEQMTSLLENGYCPNHPGEYIKLVRTSGWFMPFLFGGSKKCPKCGMTVSGV